MNSDGKITSFVSIIITPLGVINKQTAPKPIIIENEMLDFSRCSFAQNENVSGWSKQSYISDYFKEDMSEKTKLCLMDISNSDDEYHTWVPNDDQDDSEDDDMLEGTVDDNMLTYLRNFNFDTIEFDNSPS